LRMTIGLEEKRSRLIPYMDILVKPSALTSYMLLSQREA
jgi:hypothetical protein